MAKLASSRSKALKARRERARGLPYPRKTLEDAADLNAIISSKSNEDSKYEPKPKIEAEGKSIFSSSYLTYWHFPDILPANCFFPLALGVRLGLDVATDTRALKAL